MSRTPQCRCGTLIEDPAHGQVDHSLAVTIPGELIETPDRGEILGIARRTEFRVGQSQIVALEVGILLQFAGQQAAA
jgi:hypothetical protein